MNIFKNLKNFNLILLIGALFIISCDPPEPIIPKPVPGGVADGIYLIGTAALDKPLAANAMDQGRSEDNAKTDRVGMYESLYLMKQGTVTFVSYLANVATVHGGSTTVIKESITSGLAAAADREYIQGTLAKDGAVVNVPAAGLYHVVVDLTSSTFYMVKIDYFHIVGDATDSGWPSDNKAIPANQKMTWDATAKTFKVEGVTLQANKFFKLRYNDLWDVKPKKDGADIPYVYTDKDGTAVADGTFKFYTNFGTTNAGDGVEVAKTGGANFGVKETAKYTITLQYNEKPGMGVTITLVKTGDVTIAFDPEKYKWGVLGAPLGKGWDHDFDFLYKKDGTTHKWAGSFYMMSGTATEFKIRANDAWDNSLGWKQITFTGSVADKVTFSKDETGANFKFTGDTGFYYMTITTSDDGKTWAATIEPTTWGVLGDATTAGGWDKDDIDLTLVGISTTATSTHTWTVDTALSATGEWKLRANNSWDFSVGKDNAIDGGNIPLPAGGAGTYAIELKTEDYGETYKVTATKK